MWIMGVFAGFWWGANPERAWAFQIWEVFTERRQKMELLCMRLQIPETANLILGQSHFIKTAEDLYEVVVNTVPGAKFAVAFNEASGPCLIRVEGNDEELRGAAIANAQ